MKETNNLPVMELEVTFIGVQPLDFRSTDGNTICGYKLHYYTDVKESEKNHIFGKKYGTIYLAKDKLDDLDTYKNKVYPIKGKIYFEFTSLDRKPKPIKVML